MFAPLNELTATPAPATNCTAAPPFWINVVVNPPVWVGSVILMAPVFAHNIVAPLCSCANVVSEVIVVNSCGDSLKDKDIIKNKLGSYVRWNQKLL